MTIFIGYQNHIENASAITVTSEAAGFEKENAYDWLTSDWWKANSGGTVYFTVDMGVSVSVDYYAIAAHDLPNNAGTIKLQHSTNNSTWVDYDSTQTPGNSAPIFRKLASVSRRYWRFVVNSTTNASCLGVLSFGEVLELPEAVPPGFTPPHMARDHKLETNVAERGAFLGRSISRMGYELMIQQNMVTEAWVRANWESFADHADSKPFFFSWNYETYPGDTVLGWADKKLSKPKYLQSGFFSFEIKGRALHVV